MMGVAVTTNICHISCICINAYRKFYRKIWITIHTYPTLNWKSCC